MKGQEVVVVTAQQDLSHKELPPCSGVVKSLSENCLLHKYLLFIILAESILQDIPTLPAHTRAM
jgi:hypothetical protein